MTLMSEEQAWDPETVKNMLKNKGSKCKCVSWDQFQKVCGSYCKHLTANRQRKVVKKLMLDHYNKTLEKVTQKHFDKEPCPYRN